MSNNNNQSRVRNRFSEPERVTQVNDEPSLAQQHMKSETDINTIVQRYMKTGVLGNPSAATRMPKYGDFTSLEYMDMRNAIADIDQEFASLPARIRGRFQNDPHQLIRFLEKPENLPEAIKLGLVPDLSPRQMDLEKESKKPVLEPAKPAETPNAPSTP